MSPLNKEHVDRVNYLERIWKLEHFCDFRFRCLIIGRASAGKSTILQRICNTIDDPEIFDHKGIKFDDSIIDPCPDRKLHDIETQLVFKSNPKFIFHDSRGFRAVGVDEFNTVQDFIARRAQQPTLNERLHVIWYCIPIYHDFKLFTTVEQKFFSECYTYNVPVIVVFTKLDAFDDLAFQELVDRGVSEGDAAVQAEAYAMELFDRAQVKDKLSQSAYPPKHFVFFRNLDDPAAKCDSLLEDSELVIENSIRMSIEGCLDRGDDFYSQGKFEEAIVAYDESLKIVDSKLAWKGKAKAFEKLYHKAVDAIKDVQASPSKGITALDLSVTQVQVPVAFKNSGHQIVSVKIFEANSQSSKYEFNVDPQSIFMHNFIPTVLYVLYLERGREYRRDVKTFGRPTDYDVDYKFV